VLHHQPWHEAHDRWSVHEAAAAWLPEYERLPKDTLSKNEGLHQVLPAKNVSTTAGSLQST
jgi:hypothetical protein